MYIYLIKDTNGNITGFVSHIRSSSLDRYEKKYIRSIPDTEYMNLFYSLVGRDNVKESEGIGSIKIAGLSLKDEGDFRKEHLKIQKDVMDKR